MYNLIHNNRLILGPVEYSYTRFQDALEELGIIEKLPFNVDNGFIEINENTGIYPTNKTIMPDYYNGLFEELVGPFFEIIENSIIYTYEKRDRQIDHIKSDMKSNLATTRWRYESYGITVNIQGNSVWVPTAKGGRDIFLQSMQLGLDNINWKFKNLWLTLSNEDLKFIVKSILDNVQQCFDWEKDRVIEIDSASTIDELKTIILINSDMEPKSLYPIN